MAKSVRMIPATKKIHTGMPLDALSKRRVAAYARVSTDSDEQFTSYEAQIDYYTRMIKKRSDWEFVDVYTDEGITGTNTKHRDGFNRMVRDALAGKIDLIVTKSVSRFARNTVDSLTTVRKLKQAGVEVFFEKENIYTLDSKGELLITIMSSLAQEESRSISENVTWGKRKRLSDGVVQMPYGSFLGYEKGPDGTPAIVDDEAEIVRTIYDMFLMGSSVRAIADHLTSERIPTPRGKDVWSTGTVYSILRNEKYKGAALLQKTFTTDFLTKKYKINEGEVPQYYVEDSHPAIIDPHLWDITQLELARRNSLGRHYSGCGLFSGRVFCSECGSLYGPRKWKTKAEGERIAWRCANRYRNKKDCESPIVTEDALKEKFVEAFNEIYDDRDLVIECCRTLLDKYLDTADLDSEIDEAINRCEVIKGLNEKLIDENASQPMDQDAFQKKYDSYVAEYEKERQHVEELKRAKSEKNGKANQISAFMFEIHERESVIEDFDERLWITSIEKVTVNHDGSMVFSFKNGMEVTK